MRIIFATNDNKQKSKILNKNKIQYRLISYYYIKNSHEDFLPCYSKTGMSPAHYASHLLGKEEGLRPKQPLKRVKLNPET